MWYNKPTGSRVGRGLPAPRACHLPPHPPAATWHSTHGSSHAKTKPPQHAAWPSLDPGRSELEKQICQWNRAPEALINGGAVGIWPCTSSLAIGPGDRSHGGGHFPELFSQRSTHKGRLARAAMAAACGGETGVQWLSAHTHTLASRQLRIGAADRGM